MSRVSDEEDKKLYSTMNRAFLRAFLRPKYKKILKVSWCTVQKVIKKKFETGDIKNRKKS